MNNTKIIWTEKTWNPASGCSKISSGCKHCYASTLAENKRGTLAFPDGFDLTIRPHKLAEPVRLKTPSIIFVNSMSDLFWDEIPDAYRHEIFDVMDKTPQHIYQVLTKRPDKMLAWSKSRPLPRNVWAGVTCEDDRAVERIDILRDVDAAVRFISAEPLLTPLSLDLDSIHWVITGGESGGHLFDDATAIKRGLAVYDRKVKKWSAQADKVQWVRDIRDKCVDSGVAFFHKQWGGATAKSAGRDLDGRTWDEMPHLSSTPA